MKMNMWICFVSQNLSNFKKTSWAIHKNEILKKILLKIDQNIILFINELKSNYYATLIFCFLKTMTDATKIIAIARTSKKIQSIPLKVMF